jgi:hypothetical protein
MSNKLLYCAVNYLKQSFLPPMSNFAVNPYLSDEDDQMNCSNNFNKHDSNSKCAARKYLSWIKIQSFDDPDKAIAALHGEWGKDFSNNTLEGRKVYFRCKKAKSRGVKCSARRFLLYHSDSLKISLYKTNKDHDHDKTENIRGISNEVKDIIKQLINDGVTLSRQIIMALQERNVNIPTKLQLNNYIAQYKKARFGASAISLGELEKWCEENSHIPGDEDKSFVVNYIINDGDFIVDLDRDDGAYFAFFISTKRLLNIAAKSTHLHADATYKLIWQGYPVLIVGTTDLSKSFHPFGLAVCCSEKKKDFIFLFNSLQIGLNKIDKPPIQPIALVCDASFAIIKAFSAVFKNEHKVIMCWAHMKRCVAKKVSMINDKQMAREIIDDIDLLQICESANLFNNAVKLFKEKWSQFDQVNDFMKYFEFEWLEKHPGWYEGMQLYIPSTNNALEATNRTIKENSTFRNRLQLSVFLYTATKIVHNWSYDRDEKNINVRKFSTEAVISFELWTKSYEWAKQNRDIIGVNDKDNKKIFYYISCNDDEKVDEHQISKYNSCNFDSFSQFKDYFKICKIEASNFLSWKTSKCNCRNYLKNYICKHVVGIGIRLKQCKPPIEVKNIQLGQKPKRGRPAKSKKALLKQ